MPDKDTTIAASGYDSAEFTTGGHPLLGLTMPDGWTAAAITFRKKRMSDGQFVPVRDSDGNHVTIASANVAVDTYIGIVGQAADALAAITTPMKIRSGTDSVPVAQEAARTIELDMKGWIEHGSSKL